MAKILIIEDEQRLARLLTLELEYEGYYIHVCYDGKTGLNAALEENWDLIILDVMLPELSGLEVLRRLRKEDEDTPVLMLTARGEVPDKVSGLDLGANDYMSKPFETEELLARIRVQLRAKKSISRLETTNEHVLEFDDLVVNMNSREVWRGKQSIELTRREFDLLVYLMENIGNVLSREQIIQAVWGYDFMGDTNVVDVYIRYLRKKIEEGTNPLIFTVRGVGYVMKKERK